MSKKTAVASAAAFVAVASFVGFGLWKASQPAPEVFQGQMEAQEADIAPKVTARIAQILVKEGDQIAVGAPLIRMDSPEVQAKLAQATAAQEAAQAVAAKAEHGARPQEVEMARLNWQRAVAAADHGVAEFFDFTGHTGGLCLLFLVRCCCHHPAVRPELVEGLSSPLPRLRQAQPER